MARKAIQDKSSWRTPSIYIFVSGYGPFQPKEMDSIENFTVLLYDGYCKDDTSSVHSKEPTHHHPMYNFAGEAQELLLNRVDPENHLLSNGLLVVDVRDMFENKEEMDLAIHTEATQDSNITLKKVGDNTQRKFRTRGGCSHLLVKTFRRMLLKNVILAASGQLCALALILHKQLKDACPDMISSIHLKYPCLSAKFINTHMVPPKGINPKAHIREVPLHLVVKNKDDNRAELLRHYFPELVLNHLSDSSGILVQKKEFENWLSLCITHLRLP